MGERAYLRLLTVLALMLAGVVAIRAPGLGDYPTDAGPALQAIAHGHLGAFFSHQPAMGSVSLLVRAPFVVVAAALGDGRVGIYRWGALACLLAVALVAIGLSRLALRRGSGRVAPVVIVAIALLGPLVHDALYYGHPEELLTASLAVSALLAACEQRALLTGVLAGLAVASKQWALLVITPAVLVLERDRIRALLASAIVAAAATLPMIAGSLSGFRHALSYISHPQPIVTHFSWLYPLSPGGTFPVANIFGGGRPVAGHRLLGVESMLARPSILAIGLALVLMIWWLSGRRLDHQPMLECTAVVLLLRCALDPGSMGYYHYPVLLVLLALDALAGRKLPLAGLAGVAVAFVTFDRASSYLSSGAANAVYIAMTVSACVLLLERMRPMRSSIDSPLSDPRARVYARGA
jgi:hypothetical protein